MVDDDRQATRRNAGLIFICLAFLVLAGSSRNRSLSEETDFATPSSRLSRILRKGRKAPAEITEVLKMEEQIHQQSQSRVQPKPNKSKGKASTTNRGGKTPTVVFLVGLEGTGHHGVKELTTGQRDYKDPPRHSPYHKRIIETGVNQPLMRALHTTTSLMCLCNDHLYVDFQMPLRNSDGKLIGPRHRVDGRSRSLEGVSYLKQTLKTLGIKGIEGHEEDMLRSFQKIAEMAKADPKVPPYLALNAAGYDPWDELSYPNAKNCGRHSYPDLDIFAQRVEQAGLHYGFIYLYRDLYAVINSTTFNRPFNKDVETAIQLYNNMLDAIYNQFTRNPKGNLACLGMFEDSSSQSDQWDRLGLLLGYDDPQEFRERVQQKMRPPKVMTQTEKDKIIPEELRPAMADLVKKDQKVLDLCKRQLIPMSSL